MKEALKLALEALERYQIKRQDFDTFVDVITAIKEALAQPKQEPAKLWCETCEGTGQVYQEHQAGCHVGGHFKCPDCDGEGHIVSRLYSTTPPKRPWVGLTDEFCIANMVDVGHCSLQIVFKSRKNADEFKAALKEKNT